MDRGLRSAECACASVLGQRASVPGAEGAGRASKGLLPRMHSSVLLQVAGEGEALRADVALELGVVGHLMVVHMTLEARPFGHHFAADGTHHAAVRGSRCGGW